MKMDAICNSMLYFYSAKNTSYLNKDVIFNVMLYLSSLKDIFTMCCLNKEAQTFLYDVYLWKQMTNGIFTKTFTIHDYIQKAKSIHLTFKPNNIYFIDMDRNFLHTIVPKIKQYGMRDRPITLEYTPRGGIHVYTPCQSITMQIAEDINLLQKIVIHNIYADLYTYKNDYYNLTKIKYDLF